MKSSEIKDGPGGRLSIHKWANKFVGRGVLLDAFRYRISHGRAKSIRWPRKKSSLDDLKETAVAQSVELKPGTILLIRTGWMQAYVAASPEHKAAMAPLRAQSLRAVEDSSAMVEWFWDHRLAAVGTDCPAVEPWPWDFSDEGALHYRTLCLLGLPIGEQFNLEELAADCAADKRYQFMLVSAPMNLEGGIASPPTSRNQVSAPPQVTRSRAVSPSRCPPHPPSSQAPCWAGRDAAGPGAPHTADGRSLPGRRACAADCAAPHTSARRTHTHRPSAKRSREYPCDRVRG